MNEQTEYEFNSKEVLASLDASDPFLRRNFIGASDAPIIMGVSPWRTPIDLYQEKIGMRAPQKENKYMQKGKELEPIARKKFEEIMGDKFPAKRFFSDEHLWIMASLDGFNGYDAVEIKTGAASHKLAKEGIIADYYYPQLQHQMFVAGLTHIHYFSYMYDNDYTLLKCDRDDKYIYEMLKKEIEFWECVKNLDADKLQGKDFQEISDVQFDLLCEEWKIIQKIKLEISLEEEEVKKRLLSFCQNENICGSGIKIEKIKRKGSVNYSAIFELNGIDLDKYRKESTDYWKISIQEN